MKAVDPFRFVYMLNMSRHSVKKTTLALRLDPLNIPRYVDTCFTPFASKINRHTRFVRLPSLSKAYIFIYAKKMFSHAVIKNKNKIKNCLFLFVSFCVSFLCVFLT